MKGYHIDYSGVKMKYKKIDERRSVVIRRNDCIISIPSTAIKASGFIKVNVLKLIKHLTPENIEKLATVYGVTVVLTPLAA